MTSSSCTLPYISDEFLKYFPADVTFLVGPEKVEFKGHKTNLAVLSNQMCHTLKSKFAVFTFPYLNVEGFKLMMVYIYKGNVMLNSELEALKLLEIASFFQIQALKNITYIKLNGLVNHISRLEEVIAEALTIENPGLKKNVLDTIIILNGKDVLESEEFLKLNLETIDQIISNEYLQIPNEILVFKAAVIWAEHKINQKRKQITGQEIRTELGNALYSIRLPLIPVAEFLMEIQLNKEKEGIFTAEELNEVHIYHSSNNMQLDDNQRSRITSFFPKTPRKKVQPIMSRLPSQNIGAVTNLRIDDEPPIKLRITNSRVKQHKQIRQLIETIEIDSSKSGGGAKNSKRNMLEKGNLKLS